MRVSLWWRGRPSIRWRLSAEPGWPSGRRRCDAPCSLALMTARATSLATSEAW
jgi:hypothetical protein